MQKFVKISLFLALALVPAAAEAQSELKTVASVDLKRYEGKWFEIAKYTDKFQKNCVGNATANYTIKENGRIDILNHCVRKDGIMDAAKGEAKADNKANAKFKVRYTAKYLSFLPNVWANYWIIDLDPKYEYLVAGDPKRENLWILSRKPEMTDVLYQDILRRLEKAGFNPGRIEKTPQNLEVIKGGVIEKH